MASDVREALRGRQQSRLAGSSKTSSKKGKEAMEGESNGPTKEAIVRMLGDDIFEAFTRKRDEALRAAADLRKMMMMTRHSVRYIDLHERSLPNEFRRFLEFTQYQRQKEARRAKLLGLPPPSAPSNMFAVRPTGSFGIPTPEKRKQEEGKERCASSKSFLKMQMERIQNIRVARTRGSVKSAPPLQAIDLSSTMRKTPVTPVTPMTPMTAMTPMTPMTPRRPTQFSAEFLQEEPPHYAAIPSRGRPATVPAETQADLFRWMEEFFREYAPNDNVETTGSGGGPRGSLKECQLRDERMLDQLCSIASVTPSFIAESPYYTLRKSVSQPTPQRGSKYDHLCSTPAKLSKIEMKIDVGLASQLEVRRMEKNRKKSPQLRTPSLGKRKRRPQTAASSPRPASCKMIHEDPTDTTLDRALLLRDAGVEEVGNVRYICLANRGIGRVSSRELASFTSLRCLDLSGNQVPLMSLAPLTALRKLSLLGNLQSELKFPEGSFQELEVLDVSYNLLNDSAIAALSFLPSLRNLNMNNNNLELIPPEATETGAFVRLETLSAAGNNLSSTCLLSLSKLPWLETLNLHKNHIKAIPDQIAFEVRAFSRLETLDLAENPINYHPNLISLEKMQQLRKVFLWDTPLSRMLSYDGSGKYSPRSVPILQAAMRALKAGQNWYLVKTDKPIIEDWYSDKLRYAVRDNVPPGMSIDEKIKAKLEKSRRIEEEVQKAMMRNAAAERRIHLGPTSLISQSPENKEAELFIADFRKVPHTKKSPRRRSELEGLMHERMKKLQNVPSPAEPYLSQAHAAVAAARKALGMSPHEVKDTAGSKSGTRLRLGSINRKDAVDTGRKQPSIDSPRKRSSNKSKHGA